MPAPRSTLATLATVCTLALSGCGGDGPTGNSGDAVTPAEAAVLITALFEFVGDNLNLFAPAPGLAAVPYAELYDPNIDEVDECAVGGSGTLVGTISGDVDQQANTADLNIMATADFIGCRFYISELNIITLDGQPDVDFDADLMIDEEADNETDIVDVSGAVAYTVTDGRSGTCAIDAVVTITSMGTSADEVTATGSVCGANAANLQILF
jgi:hypothetical protein